LILDKTDQVGKLPEVWRSICDRDRKSPGYANIIHLNAILWAFAKRAQWDVVGAVYNKLLLGGITDDIDSTTAFPSRAFFSSKGKGLPVPNGLAASAVTFQCILRCLTYHGDLISALSVLQDMDKAGFQPVVSDFVAFFQGFARFGEGSVEDEAGTGSMMPPVDSHTPTLVPGSAPQAKPAPRRLTDIWSDGMRRKNGRADPAGGHEEWNKGTLELLFQSLLGVPPQDGRVTADSPWRLSPHPRTVPAPRPGAVFYILMAFRRVHGEDPAVLLDVLAQLERKFGPGNEEGWSGWKVDGRLRRLRENWMQARAEDAAI
jgi:pentatricopeptide repeat protein